MIILIYLLTSLAWLALAQGNAQQQLVDLAAKGNGIIKLDPTTFELLTSSKRTWSAAIHLTALDKRRRCAPCKEFEPSWLAVAKSWTTVPAEHRNSHFFATLDFDDAPAVFQKLGLTSAPAVYVYHPTEGPRQPPSGKFGPSKYDFSNGFHPGPLAKHLSNHTPVPIPYKDPVDYAKWGMIFGTLIIGLALIRSVLPLLQNRYVWAAGVIIFSLINTTGFMFTRIRSMPYTAADGNWIAAGYQSQFGQEVHVISGIYGLLGGSFLVLTLVIPSLTSPSRQRLQVYVWTAVIMLVFSMLVSLFKVKNRGYPFRLFL